MAEINNNTDTTIKRYTMFPLKYNNIYDYYKKAVASFWTVEEVDLSRDISDWKNLTDDEKHFISMVLAFFAGSDGIVIENLVERFMAEYDEPEIRAFYSFQAAVENIHSEMYSILIETLINNEKQKKKLFDAVNEFPAINKKAQWAIKWIEDSKSNFATRLVAFAIVEGIFFSGAFCSIYWLKNRGLLPGLALSNQFISRDEALHTEFAIEMYNTVIKEKEKLDKNTIHSMIKEAMEIETEFINEALDCRLIGMNANNMKEYVKFICDRLAIQLGTPKIYNSKNPFSFMEAISLEGKTNFFENRVSEYNKAEIGVEASTLTFDDNDDF